MLVLIDFSCWHQYCDVYDTILTICLCGGEILSLYYKFSHYFYGSYENHRCFIDKLIKPMILENLETENIPIAIFLFRECVYTISCCLEWVEHGI